MSIKVHAARHRAELALHHRYKASGSEWDASKLDAALQDAAYEFVRETACNTTTSTIALTAGTNSYDPTSTVTYWEQDLFICAFIGDVQVHERTISSLRRRAGMKQDQPKWLAILDDDSLYVNPTPDTSYNLDITHVEIFTRWTLGTNADTTYPIPDRFVGDVIRYGVKYHLLAGMPGHDDWPAAEKNWFGLLERARGHYAPLTRTGMRDRQYQRRATMQVNG